MKIGLYILPLTGPAELIAAIGRGADERGFDSIWVAETHLLAFPEYTATFPYAPDGVLPEIYKEILAAGELDGLLALSFISSITTRIRLGIGVCVVPQRNPLFLAKDITTLDHLSNGRFDFGVGIGWLNQEFEAAGVPFARRADRCREYVEIMTKLWSTGDAHHEGDFFSLPHSSQNPKPLQQPHPPIIIGGNSPSALRRVADLGQGWLPWELDPLEVREGVSQLARLLDERGRKPDEVEVVVALELSDSLDLESYAASGVKQLVLILPELKTQDDANRMLDHLVTTVLERARSL